MFGGPLQIPKLLSAGKRIMFTFNYQFQRNRTGTTSDPVNMPTALERTGDFSQSCRAPSTTHPTGLPFPGNQIPAEPDQFHIARAAGLFSRTPIFPFAARNYQTSWSG